MFYPAQVTGICLPGPIRGVYISAMRSLLFYPAPYVSYHFVGPNYIHVATTWNIRVMGFVDIDYWAAHHDRALGIAFFSFFSVYSITF